MRESKEAPMPARIKLLLVAHCLLLPAGFIAAKGQLLKMTSANAFYSSAIYADAGLLALWSSMSVMHKVKRFTVFILGVLCLASADMAINGRRGDMELNTAIAVETVVPSAVVCLLLTKLRNGKKPLQLARHCTAATSSNSLQFSMKHLLAITTIVCVVLASGNAIQTWEPFGEQTGTVVYVASVSACVTVVELAAIWAVLGLSRIRTRLLCLLPTGFWIAVIPTSLGFGGFNLPLYKWWAMAFNFQMLICTATLLVFRSCGWRLRCEVGEEQSSLVDDADCTEAPHAP